MTLTTGAVGSTPMKYSLQELRRHARTPEGMKKLRFVSVSGVSVVVNQVTLFVCYLLVGWDKKDSVRSLVVAFMISSTVSYLLNRRWVWRRSGRSSLRREIVPFWGVGIAQLAISVPLVRWGQLEVEANFSNKLVRTFCFMMLNLAVYLVMWFAKYMFFNKFVFADKPNPVQ